MKSRLMNFRKRTIIIWPKSHKIKTGYYGYYETEIDYIDPVFKEQDAILDESMAFNGLEKRENSPSPTKALTDKPILYK